MKTEQTAFIKKIDNGFVFQGTTTVTTDEFGTEYTGVEEYTADAEELAILVEDFFTPND